jgi:hypothetical protein
MPAFTNAIPFAGSTRGGDALVATGPPPWQNPRRITGAARRGGGP